MAKKPAPKITDAITDEAIDQAIADDTDEIVDPLDEAGPVEHLDMEATPADLEAERAYFAKILKVRIPFELKVGGKRYLPGVHTVNRGVAEVLIEMTDKKRRADMSVFVGKSHLVERLLDRTLVVTEVTDLDRRLARR